MIEFTDLSDSRLEEMVGERLANELREEVNMITEVYPELDQKAYLNSEISPVFFGSAVNNFGV